MSVLMKHAEGPRFFALDESGANDSQSSRSNGTATEDFPKAGPARKFTFVSAGTHLPSNLNPAGTAGRFGAPVVYRPDWLDRFGSIPSPLNDI